MMYTVPNAMVFMFFVYFVPFVIWRMNASGAYAESKSESLLLWNTLVARGGTVNTPHTVMHPEPREGRFV